MLEGTYLDPKLGRVPFREWVDRWWATTMHLRPSSRARAEGIVRNWLCRGSEIVPSRPFVPMTGEEEGPPTSEDPERPRPEGKTD